jgi:hypothetical protein
MLTQALKDLQVVLAKRGIELDTYEVIEGLYEELSYPISELEAYFQHLEQGQKPNINEKTADIFAFFVTKKFDELKDGAKEVDEDYTAVRAGTDLQSIHGSRSWRLPRGLSSGDRFPAGSGGLAAQRARAR